jgi:hypothetical protein
MSTFPGARTLTYDDLVPEIVGPMSLAGGKNEATLGDQARFIRPDRILSAFRALPSGTLNANLSTGTGYDASSRINELLGNLSAEGGGTFALDRGANAADLQIPSNVCLEGACPVNLAAAAGIGLVNGLQSGRPLIRNANPIGNGGEAPTDRGITIRNLYLNGGRALNASGAGVGQAQNISTASASYYPAGWPNLFNDPDRFTPKNTFQLTLVLFGASNVLIENVWVHDPCAFGMCFSNVDHLTVRRYRQTLPEADIPSTWSGIGNRDGPHFGGLCRDVLIDGAVVTADDDAFPFNAPEYYAGPIERVRGYGMRADRSVKGITFRSAGINVGHVDTFGRQYVAYLDDIEIHAPSLHCSSDHVNLDVEGGEYSDARTVKVLGAKLSLYGAAYSGSDSVVTLRGNATDLTVTASASGWADASAGGGRKVIKVDAANTPDGTNIRGRVAVTIDAADACPPQTLVSLEAGTTDIDWSGTANRRADGASAGGKVFDLVGGNHIVRGANIQARRCGDLVNVGASATLTDLQLAVVRHELVLAGSSLVKGAAGTTPIGLVSNYKGPLDGSGLPKLTTHTVTAKRGDAWMTNGAADGGTAAASGLLAKFLADYNFDEAAGNPRADSYGGPSFAEVNGAVTSQAGLIGNCISPGANYLSMASNANWAGGGGASFCLPVWVFTSSLFSQARVVVGKWKADNTVVEYLLYLDGTVNRWQWLVSNDGSTWATLNAAAQPTANGWYFLWPYVDTVNHKIGLWINGVQETEVAFTGTVAVTSQPVTAGNTNGGTGSTALIGLEDQLSMGHFVPSGAEVSYLYNGGAGRAYPY